jgi:thiamine biosynthesis lipoprotein
MRFEIVLYAPSEEAANRAAEAAFRRIRALNQVFSDYEPDSELMRLCRTAGSGQAVPVSAELFAVLHRAERYSQATDGAFDVSVGPLVRLWRTARKSKTLPAAEAREAARKLVDYRKIRLDEKQRTVELKQAGMQLDLGGIAVGYACDAAIEAARGEGITRILVDGSGDISAGDPPPGREGWTIGVAPLEPEGPPSRRLRLKNASVSTSGDAFQFVEIEGVRYSHIVDPKTGLGVAGRRSVTVLAPDGMAADALATAITILGPERGRRLAESSRNVEFLFVTGSDSGVETVESPGFSSHLLQD